MFLCEETNIQSICIKQIENDSFDANVFKNGIIV